MIGPSFHEEIDLIGIFGGKGFVDDLPGQANVGSMADVCDDDIVVLQLWDQFSQVVEMKVSSSPCPIVVFLIEEGTFGDQDFAFSDTRQLFKVSPCGIPEVGDQRDIDRVGDLMSVLSQLGDFMTGGIKEFGF